LYAAVSLRSVFFGVNATPTRKALSTEKYFVGHNHAVDESAFVKSICSRAVAIPFSFVIIAALLPS
jgi:hypothetical protein